MIRTATLPAARAMRFGFGSLQLGVDAATVIALRCVAIAGGGAAGMREAGLMVDEKVRAAWELSALLATGQLGAHPAVIAERTLGFYGKRVRANRRRLAGAGRSG